MWVWVVGKTTGGQALAFEKQARLPIPCPDIARPRLFRDILVAPRQGSFRGWQAEAKEAVRRVAEKASNAAARGCSNDSSCHETTSHHAVVTPRGFICDDEAQAMADIRMKVH